MRDIRISDTATGQVVPLVPREAGHVGIYACGPTVYSRIHVGNARPFVVFSLLKRFLEHQGYATTLVVNVTDVNDKIYAAAREQAVPSEDLAREMTAHYIADTDGLGLGRPDHEPLATETVGEIIDLIGALIERGHAYVAEGDVYFRVRSDDRYGSLSHRQVDDMDQGEGVEGASRKQDPLDFALWKAEKPDEDTAWDAPWGRGRPGWHIECSAMAESLLGVGFDIHGGGIDLVFPHHENEAAQTRMGRGAELAKIWMHNGMLQIPASDAPGEMGGDELEKMAKSVGNIRLLGDVLAEHGRDALLLYFVGGHYRQPISFSDERLEEAARSVARLREAGRRLVPGDSPPEMAPLRERFLAALADDFNTPKALAAVFDWVSEANRRAASGAVTGDADLRLMLGLFALDNLLDAATEDGTPDDAAQALLERRETARAARDFDAADRLRDELAAAGWAVRDGPSGPELVRAG
jgi:cysteinyl-tRNA synthetase